MSTDNDLLEVFLKVVAYVTPYFLIPVTFKYGLGVFGNIAGMINDRSRGIFDKQRKYREGKKAQNYQAFKTGTGRGALRQSGLYRRAGMNIGAGWEGRFGFGERGAQARSQLAGLAALEGVMKNPRWSQIQENDDALRAATYGSHNEAVAALTARWGDEDRAKRAAAAAGASIGYGRSQAIAAAKQLATTGTGYASYRDSAGNKISALEDQAETIARASGGDTNTIGDIAGYNNFIHKQKGNFHLSPGAGKLIELSTQEAQGGFATRADREGAYNTATRQAWNSTDIQSAVRGKGPEIEQFSSHFRDVLADPGATQVHKRDAAVALAELHAALPGASAENQKYINDTMLQLGIDHDTGSVEDQLSALLAGSGVAMSPSEINGLARKYGSGVPSQVATGTEQPPVPPPAAA